MELTALAASLSRGFAPDSHAVYIRRRRPLVALAASVRARPGSSVRTPAERLSRAAERRSTGG
jgi:hypothetical protein